MDSQGNHIGKFYVQSLLPKSTDAWVAYWVYTSSQFEYEIFPQQGFLAPGESGRVGILWPSRTKDGRPQPIQENLDLLKSSHFFVKSLPISSDYFE